MMQQHAEGSVRHAEKRRAGTCQFANRIARTSLDAYERSVPHSYREANKQTCVAAIVAHLRGDDSQETANNANDQGGDSNSRLQVIGLGVGTKFLPDAIIREEQLGTSEEDDGYGKRIRDCHAEVLARRAFRRQIALEILADLKSSHDEEGGKIIRNSREVVNFPILERIEHSDHDSNHIGDEENSLHAAVATVCYRLRPCVTLHFYASSAPCGNAALKKFTKMEKEKFDASLGPDEWPQQTHNPIAAHSLRLGQFALLVKKDGSISQSTLNEDELSDTKNQEKGPAREKKRRKPWPCREDDSWCPPSCSITNYNKGTVHSCSDKICRWNCLGLQGSLLSSILDGPLYMTSLTVGRKFSRAICQRAVCCRADGFGLLTKKKSCDDSIVEDFGNYKLNHPILMETNVYMDEAGTHDMAGAKSIGQDATFDCNMCWVWWPDKSPDFGYAADCLDGKSGLRINYHDIGDLNNGDATPPTFSACSTFALFQLNREILQNNGVSNMAKRESQSKLTLSDLRLLKRQVSPKYESVKTAFFRHRVFGQWYCREC